MPDPLLLTSVHNSRVKDVVRLRNRRHRQREKRFVIEGLRELTAAVEATFPVQTLYYCTDFHTARGEAELVQRFATADTVCEETSAAVFKKMSYRRTPDGLLGVAEAPSLALDALPARRTSTHSLWLIAAGLEKPGNLGAMLRSLDAVGGDGLLVADGVADVFNPNAVRASVGALFGIPIAAASGRAVREWLDAQNIRLVAASPHAAQDYSAMDLRGHIAFAVGSESGGLDADWLADAASVHIPMAGRVDSVNAATAAALLLFEARQQQRPASDAGVRTEGSP